MELSELHLLLTYQCTLECDHCFVWGSPSASGTLTLQTLHLILRQAEELGTVEALYFEGGEPFLYQALLLEGARQAARRGWRVGIVTNAYWALGEEDARLWLEPFAGLVTELSISSDRYHSDSELSPKAQAAHAAAEALGIPAGLICVAQPQAMDAAAVVGRLPAGQSRVMYRGRAAVKLAPQAAGAPWETFTTCPYEDLRAPDRIHLDPFGYAHICQGIALGNIFHTPLREIVTAYRPDEHPICGPLLHGGPAELARTYGFAPAETYADACHLCYAARLALLDRFPDVLAPRSMYGLAG